MDHFCRARFFFSLILGSAISPLWVTSALALGEGPYHYSEKDLREVPEGLACLQIKNALAANPDIVPIPDVNKNCLRTVAEEAPACRQIWRWKASQSCQDSQVFMIKNAASAKWTPCLYEEEIKRYEGGGSSSRDVLKCGKNYFSGVPDFEEIVLKSAQGPGEGYYYNTDFLVTNPLGESERYRPIHSYIKKLVISAKPVAKKDNLTTKYYFPVQIIVLAKYQPADLSSTLYVKRSAEFLVRLGSSKKPLQR